jgi:hypothetical protein
MIINMSIRNKKLTALHGLPDPLDSSLRNSRNLRHHSHEDKPERVLLDKLAEKPTAKRFQVVKRSLPA